MIKCNLTMYFFLDFYTSAGIFSLNTESDIDMFCKSKNVS